MVKNEADIIESFVRYNINIFDGMIILDNGSTDNTVNILKSLEKEGLHIIILEDEDREFIQVDKMNRLLLKAVNEFKADIIAPLDADEFLISSKGGNPRKTLENIEISTFYQVKWKTYVPNFNKNENKKFIPAKITHARDINLDEFYKVVIPKELVESYAIKLTKGNHNLEYNSKYNDSIKRVSDTDLYIAHFPIRSKEQATSKISVMWLNCLRDPQRKENQSWHLKKMFNELKKNGKIEDKDVVNFAKRYALQDEEIRINLKEDPIDLSFCKDIQIKYTKNEINPMSNLLESCEWISLIYLNSKKNVSTEEEKLKIQIENLKNEKRTEEEKFKIQIENLENEKRAEKKKLKSKIKEYENSTSWTITSPLRKISAILKKLRN